MDLGKRLKAKRKEKNISAEYLAKELGISVSTVYRYEDSSILKIPVSTFEKMCDILGTTPAQMMGNVPEKTVDIKSGNDLPVNFDNPKDAMEFLLKKIITLDRDNLSLINFLECFCIISYQIYE